MKVLASALVAVLAISFASSSFAVEGEKVTVTGSRITPGPSPMPNPVSRPGSRAGLQLEESCFKMGTCEGGSRGIPSFKTTGGWKAGDQTTVNGILVTILEVAMQKLTVEGKVHVKVQLPDQTIVEVDIDIKVTKERN